MKPGKINNTQPERTTHHVMYRVIYFKAYDNVINGTKERFHQPKFEIYKHIENIFIKTQLTKNVTKILSNFHRENLTVQLGQLAAFLDTSNISVTKLLESLVNFGKNQSQKCCCPEYPNSQNCERSFSAMKRIKTYLRSTTHSGNRLNH